jgi:hypothetical protein
VPSYPPNLHAPGSVPELHLQSTPQAVAHEAGVAGVSAVAVVARGVPIAPAAGGVFIIPPAIHPTSSCL